MSAPIHRWVGHALSPEVERALTRVAACDDVVHVAAMPDIHLADGVCVGCVVATRELLYPDAVGGDIGCGMAVVRFTSEAAVDRLAAARLLAHLGEVIPVQQHAAMTLPELPSLSSPALTKLARSVGRVQFATLGRGNHFVELQRSLEGELWLMVHSGSRGIGQAIRDHHRVALLAGLAGDHAHDYLADVTWALDYARASRRTMVERAAAGVVAVLGGEVDWASHRDCHHNDVRREVHGAQTLWVHRKGAIAAGRDVPGVIPGSMGSVSHHVVGRGEATSLASSSHGAGRCLSRGDARRAISRAVFERQVAGVWFDRRASDLLRDEAPGAYKDIGQVMRAQRELTTIARTLHPLLSYKGA